MKGFLANKQLLSYAGRDLADWSRFIISLSDRCSVAPLRVRFSKVDGAMTDCNSAG